MNDDKKRDFTLRKLNYLAKTFYLYFLLFFYFLERWASLQKGLFYNLFLEILNLFMDKSHFFFLTLQIKSSLKVV